MSSDEIRVVTISSALDETPEGMHRMDRLQRKYDAWLASMDPATRDLAEKIRRDVEHQMLYGTQPTGCAD